MRLTKAGEYAIRCFLHLARLPQGSVIPRHEISQSMDIPYQFLGKIGVKLASAGLIRISQGSKGGYSLGRPAERVTLLDVIEAVEGSIFLNDCLIHPDVCHQAPVCSVHQVWLRAQQGLRDTLASVNFAQLAGCHDAAAPVSISATASAAVDADQTNRSSQEEGTWTS